MILFSGLFFTSVNLQAAEAAAVPQQCQKLFKATDQLVAEAERQPGTHTQVSKIKNKLNQSKKQILEMELATQIKSCDQGLVKLNSLKQQEQETN
ncbi:DUF5339 domain-containing protein [Mannheimia massilioguelmaensis]|uniref:DUF5339 domain-containing protein n=1 Tax=Mannheimia massilioguelmaensis TaxID=1604354 RepID=UPI0005C98343|nr:DUF5339 domain-containing protein [Mannheimia massilioguelmaensis]